MTSANPLAGWEKVGDQFYRKVQLYDTVFDEDLELENYIVTGAPYGGALGTANLEIKLHSTDISKHSIETKPNFKDTELAN